MQRDNKAGSIGSASVHLEDAWADAGSSRMLSFVKVEEESLANVRASQTLRNPKIPEAIQSPKMTCRICGRPSERKRRRDGSWFYYDRCRGCRRLPASTKPGPVSITDGKLLRLLQELYGRLWALRERGFPGAPKKIVRERIKSLLRVLKN